MTNEFIQQKLTEKFGDSISGFQESFGIMRIEAPKEINLKVLNFLHDDEALQFRFLTDICAAHYPNRKGAELEVIYHLHNLSKNVRLRLVVSTSTAQPDVFSATGLFASANWMERETFDFFGVNFIGHPNLKRILNVDEMDYFPLRKEFPLEDQSRVDKDDEMFGRGGSIGFGTVKHEGETVVESEKDNEGESIV